MRHTDMTCTSNMKTFVIFTLILLTVISTSEGAVSPEAVLISHLRNTTCYDPYVRPVVDPDNTLKVYVRIALSSVKELVEKDLTMTSVGWMIAIWRDELLNWDPAEWSGITKVVLPAHLVWKPEVNVINSVHRSPDWGLTADTRVVLHNTGLVDWRIGFLWHTNCNMNLRNFPFDTQTCKVKIGSWTYNISQMELTLVSPEVITSIYEPSSEWTLEDTELTRVVSSVAHIIYMSLTLKRHPAYYVLNIVAPAMLVSLMTLLIFCLPHESGEKVSLGVTVLLSFTVVMLSINEVSPKGGDEIPIIAIYIVVSLILAGLSVALSIITSSLFHKPSTKPVSNYLWVLLARKNITKVQPVPYGGWMAKTEPKTDNRSEEIRPDSLQTQVVDLKKMCPEERAEMPVAEVRRPEDPVCVLLSLIQKRYQEENALEQNRQNWRHVAMVLDRIFFWIVAICVVCCNLFLLITIMSS